MATPRYWLGAPPDLHMRVPQSIRNCTMFIGVELGPDDYEFGGTAFVVSVPLEHIPNKYWMYLVTARHSIEDLAKKHTSYVIRANKNDGEAAVFTVARDFRWWTHPTEEVDAVVAEMHLPEEVSEIINYRAIPISDFLTDESRQKYSIGEGDEVLITGLFKRVAGGKRNVPIVRSGIVAMMQDEPIPHRRYNLVDAYLIESRSIGGLSGSPVFVVETMTFGPTKRRNGETLMTELPGKIYFMGSMIGHWDLPLDYEDMLKKEAVNMGISMVTPAKKILEIIMRPELVEARKKNESDFLKSQGPTLDSGFDSNESKPFTQEDFEAALRKASRKRD